MKLTHRVVVFAGTAVLILSTLGGQGALAAPDGAKAIKASDLKTWLSALSSDEFEGRATFTEGLGLAASYIANELRAMGVKPGGTNGSYFQRVAVLGVKSTSRSSITVTVGGESRTFKDGESLTFPKNSGGKRTLTSNQIEFVGYGASVPTLKYDDYAGRNVAGKVVVFIGARGPKGAETPANRRLLAGRARFATDTMNAIGSVGPAPFGAGPASTPTPTPSPSPAEGGRPGPQPTPVPDFTTVQRLDSSIAPAASAQDEFFEFLFSKSGVTYAELKAKADNQEPLPPVSLKDVSITFNIDADYRVVRTQFTRNVVGVIEGSDSRLKDTFVAFGAHYDHVGYAEGELADSPQGQRRVGAPGRVKENALEDRIWNGADDDGSGTVTLLSVAKAFASGPKPKRSLLFVWHAGEERGLLGSRYYADYPTISTDKIVTQLNIDMVGRNRDDKADESNKVYLVGSDRISTELHNLSEDVNSRSSHPMTLDYELNDPSDPEQVYYRSDHYSYAAKGIPIIFYTTALHSDYHANTDTVDKIGFEKMERIARLIYETGRRVATSDKPPARDNKGPRAGKGSTGKLPIS